MIDDSEPPSKEALARYWAWHDEVTKELEAELEIELAMFDRLLSLLAWVYRQIDAPSDLEDPRNWPGVWPMDWPETRTMVFRDPLLFDLARFQTSADLEMEPDRDLSIPQEMEVLAHAALLLRSTRPLSGQGMKAGRGAVRALTIELRDRIDEWNVWQVPTQRADREDEWSHRPTDYGFSEVLATLLNEHPLLVDHPEAVPTAEDIRNILRALDMRR